MSAGRGTSRRSNASARPPRGCARNGWSSPLRSGGGEIRSAEQAGSMPESICPADRGSGSMPRAAVWWCARDGLAAMVNLSRSSILAAFAPATGTSRVCTCDRARASNKVRSSGQWDRPAGQPERTFITKCGSMEWRPIHWISSVKRPQQGSALKRGGALKRQPNHAGPAGRRAVRCSHCRSRSFAETLLSFNDLHPGHSSAGVVNMTPLAVFCALIDRLKCW